MGMKRNQADCNSKGKRVVCCLISVIWNYFGADRMRQLYVLRFTFYSYFIDIQQYLYIIRAFYALNE